MMQKSKFLSVTLADWRVDNRIMYTAGVAALRQRLFDPEFVIAFGVPLSATGKNLFFERAAAK